MPTAPRAPLVEVFRSVQGEGAFVGELQTFVRLAVCPLRCRYCDSEDTWESRDAWRAVRRGESAARRAESWERRNPASVEEVVEAVDYVEEGEAPRTISITGGEPLVHPEFLAELLPALRRNGRRIHLETAGVHAGALPRLAPHLDHVSADVKLASTMEVGDFAGAHRQFLTACAAARLDTAVKCVITPRVTDAELEACAAMVASIDLGLLFILQPVTPMRLETEAVAPERVEALAALARRALPRVRVLPQVHRLLRLP